MESSQAAIMKQVKEDYDPNVTKEASAFTVYSRSWYYIKDIDLTDRNHFDAVVEFKYKPLCDSLNKAIQHFEELEEYEKCAKLLKIQKLKRKIKNNQVPQNPVRKFVIQVQEIKGMEKIGNR